MLVTYFEFHIFSHLQLAKYLAPYKMFTCPAEVRFQEFWVRANFTFVIAKMEVFLWTAHKYTLENKTGWQLINY